MEKYIGFIIIGIVVLVVVILIGYVISTYNRLVQSRGKVKNSWAQIDVQLKRRFDLIPNLMETVKGYAAHEKSIIEQFAKARNMFQNASEQGNVGEISQANNLVSQGLGRLMAIQESYPELKANTSFEQMMKELRDSEDKISYTRQFYNDVVMSYNNLLQYFPSNIIASMFKFKEATHFEALKEEKENVKVKF